MKAIIEIDDKQKCKSCPFCQLHSLYYCTKSHKFIDTPFIYTSNGIPEWCELEFVK